MLRSRTKPLYSPADLISKEHLFVTSGRKKKDHGSVFPSRLFKIFLHSRVIIETRCLTAASRDRAFLSETNYKQIFFFLLTFHFFEFCKADASRKDWEYNQHTVRMYKPICTFTSANVNCPHKALRLNLVSIYLKKNKKKTTVYFSKMWRKKMLVSQFCRIGCVICGWKLQ